MKVGDAVKHPILGYGVATKVGGHSVCATYIVIYGPSYRGESAACPTGEVSFVSDKDVPLPQRRVMEDTKWLGTRST